MRAPKRRTKSGTTGAAEVTPAAKPALAPASRVELVIECSDAATAEALDEALMPDNRYFPKDQRFDATRDGPSLRFVVGSPRPRQALSTVASIVSDARLFRDIWVEAKAGGGGRPLPGSKKGERGDA
jgi:hypothetical protein